MGTAATASGATGAFDALIAAATSFLNPSRGEDRESGQVASTLVTVDGSEFSGVCIDTPCGTGFCAEHAAIAAMVTARQFRIARIVAVWRDDAGTVHVVSPCGRCRELIRQIDPGNLDTEVVLGPDRSLPLQALLPEHDWPGG